MRQIIPRGNLVLVRELEENFDTWPEFIRVHHSMKFDGYSIGEVVGKGPKTSDVLNIGDKILYSKSSGTPFKLDDKKVLVIQEDVILAKVS